MRLKLGNITKKNLTDNIAHAIGIIVGIDWDNVKFTPIDLKEGMFIEYEHGSKDTDTNITNDDPIITAKIAWAHLKENPEYYQLLRKVEA